MLCVNRDVNIPPFPFGEDVRVVGEERRICGEVVRFEDREGRVSCWKRMKEDLEWPEH